MKRMRHGWRGLLPALLILVVLSSCGKADIDKGLLKKTLSALDTLEVLEIGGWRQDYYLSDKEGKEIPAQSSEVWFRPSGEAVDWYIGSSTYGDSGLILIKSEMAQRGNTIYRQFSSGDTITPWAASHEFVPSEIGSPNIDFIGKSEDYEFFRIAEDGSIVYAYSQTGLDAYHARQVAQAERAEIQTEIDGQPISAEQQAAQKQNHAYAVAVAEQSEITALSGTVVLDAEGNLLRHDMSLTREIPQLALNAEGSFIAGSTRTVGMRIVTEILARTDTGVAQELAVRFAGLPER